MRSFLDNYRLVMAIAAVVLMIGLLGVAATDRLQRGAHAAETASTAIQRRVLDLLKLSRLLEDFPLAIGTGSEKAARARLESALGRLQTLPEELADHAAQARAAGNAMLAETAERTRIEIQDDLLTLISAVDRIARQERPLVASAHAKRITGLILQRLLPALSLPQLVLDSERNRLSRRRQDMAILLAGLAGILVPGMVAFVILPVARAEAHKLRQAQAQLDRAALTDPVTGLPNHRATRRYLESLPRRERVLIIAFEIAPAFDLPDGNEAEIAIGVAGTVGKRLRELETGALFLGQARATRFCIVLPAQENGEISFAQHRDLESLADEPVQLDHRRVRLVFRAGVAVRRPNRPALAALENAGIALDRARAQRATTPVGYRPEYRRKRLAAQRLAQELRVALMSGEVRPHFQPQIDLRTGAVMGMEALARWHHPRRGVLPPGAFMSQAQRTGLDEPLGEVMLRLGLEALRSWDERGLQVPTVGINAAASQLNNPLFFDFVRWELDRQRVPPERLAIEVLEDIYTPSDDDPIARNLRRLSRIGVRIDLDDFGTAATSVIGMRRYQATRIKIDKSYIRDIGASATNQTLVATMVQMARNMHIESLAEGVETPAERAWLAHVGCDYIQGYVVARPMPLEESFEWLARYRVPPPQASGQQG